MIAQFFNLCVITSIQNQRWAQLINISIDCHVDFRNIFYPQNLLNHILKNGIYTTDTIRMDKWHLTM